MFAVRLYRKIWTCRQKEPVISYLVITGNWKNNIELKYEVTRKYPSWVIDSVVATEK